MSKMLRTTQATSNLRYLHYQPTPGREKEPIKEPQYVEAIYKYVTLRDTYPEMTSGINETYYGNDYINSIFYDWDNYQYKYYGEWWDHLPFTGMIFVFGIPLAILISSYSIEKHNMATNGDILNAGYINWINVQDETISV